MVVASTHIEPMSENGLKFIFTHTSHVCEINGMSAFTLTDGMRVPICSSYIWPSQT